MRKASFDDLAAFACVARHRSFTRAAAELGISTSNLSHTIKRLETCLGVRLLQRNSRSVSANAAGTALLGSIGPALETIDGALERLDSARDAVSGILRITATRQAYERVVRPVLPAFTAAHPDATIEVLVEYGFRDIIADQFDAGIRLGEKLQQDVVALKVGPELKMAVVASPAYLACHGLPTHPEQLVAHRCINYRMVAAETIYAWEFEKEGRPLEVRVSGPLVFNEPQIMLDCAIDGLGIAYLLEDDVAGDVAAGRLVQLLSDWEVPFPGFHLYYASRSQMRPVLSAFLSILRAQRGMM